MQSVHIMKPQIRRSKAHMCARVRMYLCMFVRMYACRHAGCKNLAHLRRPVRTHNSQGISQQPEELSIGLPPFQPHSLKH